MIIIENNTADEAGSAVYGGEIDHCYLHTTSQQIMYSSIVSSIIFKVLHLCHKYHRIPLHSICATLQTVLLELKYTAVKYVYTYLMSIQGKSSMFQ